MPLSLGAPGSDAAMDRLTGLRDPGDLMADVQDGSHDNCETVLIDIAGLNWLNSELGHAEGDMAIRLIGSLIESRAGQSGGKTYRIAGEEFLVLLPRSSHTEALRLASGILAGCSALRIRYRCPDEQREYLAVNAVVMRLTLIEIRDIQILRDHLAQRIYDASLSQGRRFGLVIDSPEAV
ncbi:hypothetical protein CCP4SC76_5250009 [Gammaproteobacteria bacterium]